MPNVAQIWEWIAGVLCTLLVLGVGESVSFSLCKGYFRAKREHLKELTKLGSEAKYE